MSTRVATEPRGLRHEAAFYDSEAALLAVVVPFLVGGVEAGEPTLVAVDTGNTLLIRAALGDMAGISVLDAKTEYVRPATTLKTYQKLLAQYLAEGPPQIRLLAEIPGAGTSRPWEWWARYEATINHIFADVPLWAVCAYDTRTTPAGVLADVARTHPHLANPAGEPVANARFEDPRSFLTRSPACGADPLEATPPMLDLVDPTPAAARRATRTAAEASLLTEEEVADMIYAVHEALTNALDHGLPPVRLRVWASPDRIVATITDQGPGPTNPYAGLLPPAPGHSGGPAGLWLVHQTSSHVTLGTDDDGFTLRLIAGLPALTT